MRSAPERLRVQRECMALDEACEILSRLLTQNAGTLSSAALYRLRNAWAYLHECHCACGERPRRFITMAAQKHADAEIVG